jgi:hypothetical protein
MKKFSTTIIAASILLPGIIAAEDLESYVHRMIENAKEGNGTVIIENHSSVSTGGQVAGAGQTVTTGDVSASSHTETRINAGGDGGTVYVKTETKRNGEVEKSEEYTKNLDPKKPIEVNVSAKADAEDSEVEAVIQGEVARESTTSSEEDGAASATAFARFEAALASVPTFFKKVFSFAKFW